MCECYAAFDTLDRLNRAKFRRLTMEDSDDRIAARDVVDQYGYAAPDGVRLLLMGRVDHAGAG